MRMTAGACLPARNEAEVELVGRQRFRVLLAPLAHIRAGEPDSLPGTQVSAAGRFGAAV